MKHQDIYIQMGVSDITTGIQIDRSEDNRKRFLWGQKTHSDNKKKKPRGYWGWGRVPATRQRFNLWIWFWCLKIFKF